MGIADRILGKILVPLAVILFLGCGESQEQDNLEQNEQVSQVKEETATTITGVSGNAKLTIGDSIEIVVETSEGVVVDSTKSILNGSEIISAGNQIKVPTSDILPGRTTLTIEVFLLGRIEKHSFLIEMLSDIVPEEFTYQRVTYYTHDPDAFTQGLFYHDGFIYENTGRKGESSLRKVELTTGKILEQSFLGDQYFGEGITLWNNQIIQLTWYANLGFIYTLDGFEQVKTFNYPTEGWGITSMEDRLVMSDGSETLYFMDPATLTQTDRLKVYDNQGPVTNLNELEYIEGLIYANVWHEDYIVTIDPNTGKVMTRIDLTGLMDANWSRRLDVLNGIAYDKSGKRLFVTGKWWPRLYEIRIVEKKPS